MSEALASGILLGLAAGLAPGPLLALVVAQSLRHGAGHGLRVAAAPLLTDAPIVAGSLLLVGAAARLDGLLALVSLAGAAVVAWLALDAWRAAPPGTGDVDRAPRSWTRGVAVNLLSPHPYLFWLAVGAPVVLGAAATAGPAGAAAFLAGFYGCLVGAKAAIAVVTARARGLVAGRGYRIALRVLAVLLAAFAAVLAVEALATLAGGPPVSG